MNQRRFSGTRRLYGEDAFSRFRHSRICVVGVGGVGSWAAEALVRSGIGNLRLIDLDHVAESNINRQLQALQGTLGMAKVVALERRFREIAPDCQVESVEEFVGLENMSRLLAGDIDYLVDCIDNHRIKAALIAYCRRSGIRLITVGGAGGQRDPGKIRISDLRRTEQDPLLASTRRLLRKEYGFSSNPRRRFGVAAVWSSEPVRRSGQDGTAGLHCAGLGSSMPVTAGFGLLAAGHVLEGLASSCANPSGR